MADDFSIRARKARLTQGLPAVVADRAALNRLGGLVALPTIDMVGTSSESTEPAGGDLRG